MLVNPAGIKKCRVRFGEAQEELALCKQTKTHAEFARHWYRFLIAACAIIHILESACRKDRKARQWFGEKRHKDRKDPLLLYMYQARNADEHGIEPVTKVTSGGWFIGAPGESVHIEHLTLTPSGPSGRIRQNPDGSYPTVGTTPPQLHLLSVSDDRFPDQKFDPPKEHMGAALDDCSPFGVAQSYLEYLSTSIEEASALR